MATNRLDASYDKNTDVLYITSGRVNYTKNMEEEAGLVLRYDLKTAKPVGATIIDFREYWSAKRGVLIRRLADFFGIRIADARKLINSV